MENTPYEKKALNNVSLTINEGEFVAIAGHTGSGKSTLMQHFNGLLNPTRGEVFIDGIDINKKKDKKTLHARRSVGMVFQYPEQQLFEESIFADIAFGPRNFGCSEDEVKQRVKEAMDFVELDYEEYKDKSAFLKLTCEEVYEKIRENIFNLIDNISLEDLIEKYNNGFVLDYVI